MKWYCCERIPIGYMISEHESMWSAAQHALKQGALPLPERCSAGCYFYQRASDEQLFTVINHDAALAMDLLPRVKRKPAMTPDLHRALEIIATDKSAYEVPNEVRETCAEALRALQSAQLTKTNLNEKDLEVPVDLIEVCREIAAVAHKHSLSNFTGRFNPGFGNPWRNEVTFHWEQGRHGADAMRLRIDTAAHITTTIDGKEPQR